MTVSLAKRQRERAPQLTHGARQQARSRFDHTSALGFIKYSELEISSLVSQWHYHDEYELHLVSEGSGTVHVGDYAGSFKPGNLVLTGPKLPHNWVPLDTLEPNNCVSERILHFAESPFLAAVDAIPELSDVKTLLKRAKYGIEFFGLSDVAASTFDTIKNKDGIERFTEFLLLIARLTKHENYRLLTGEKLQVIESQQSLRQINEVVDYLKINYAEELTMAQIAQSIKMSSSCFSRYFKRATDYTFTGFVNHLRVNKACLLLMETDFYISTICYQVGYNNVANFNRRFKSVKGMTPKEFRVLSEQRFG